MSTPALQSALQRIHDFGYQPMYNGRPSCPFCFNFIDEEGQHRHRTNCVLVAALISTQTKDVICSDCERWKILYNVEIANGHIGAARVFDHRIAAHERWNHK